jgi:hypothetical protein
MEKKSRVTPKIPPDTWYAVLDENNAVFDEILASLDIITKNSGNQPLPPEGKILLATARKLLENNKRILRILGKQVS